MGKNWVQELNSQLHLYADDCDKELIEAANKVSQRGRRELEAKSPVRTGKYSRGWHVKKVGSRFIVHNADRYRLTHLLEKGHVNRDGSRTAARPHMRKVEQSMIKEFEQEVIRGVQRL